MFSVLLMTVSSALAEKIGLELKINIYGEQHPCKIQQTMIVEENISFMLEDAYFVVRSVAKVVDDKVSIETEICEKNDKGEQVVVSSPAVLVEFGKTGWLKLGKKADEQDTSSLTLEVRPFRVEK